MAMESENTNQITGIFDKTLQNADISAFSRRTFSVLTSLAASGNLDIGFKSNDIRNIPTTLEERGKVELSQIVSMAKTFAYKSMGNEEIRNVFRDVMLWLAKFYPEGFHDVLGTLNNKIALDQYTAKETKALVSKIIPSGNHVPNSLNFSSADLEKQGPVPPSIFMHDFFELLKKECPEAAEYMDKEMNEILKNPEEKAKIFPTLQNTMGINILKKLGIPTVKFDDSPHGDPKASETEARETKYNELFNKISPLAKGYKEISNKLTKENLEKLNYIKEFRVLAAVITGLVDELVVDCKCQEMTGANNSHFLCASHKTPKNCPALDYELHLCSTLAYLLDNKSFYLDPFEKNDNTGIEAAAKSISSMIRRSVRVFVHAYVHHRKIFDKFENEHHVAREFFSFAWKFCEKLGEKLHISPSTKEELIIAESVLYKRENKIKDNPSNVSAPLIQNPNHSHKISRSINLPTFDGPELDNQEMSNAIIVPIPIQPVPNHEYSFMMHHSTPNDSALDDGSFSPTLDNSQIMLQMMQDVREIFPKADEVYLKIAAMYPKTAPFLDSSRANLISPDPTPTHFSDYANEFDLDTFEFDLNNDIPTNVSNSSSSSNVVHGTTSNENSNISNFG